MNQLTGLTADYLAILLWAVVQKHGKDGVLVVDDAERIRKEALDRMEAGDKLVVGATPLADGGLAIGAVIVSGEEELLDADPNATVH